MEQLKKTKKHNSEFRHMENPTDTTDNLSIQD